MTTSVDRTRTRIIVGLKHALRPIRPALLPIWHRVQGVVEPSTAWQPFTPVDRGATPAPIRVLTKAEFDDVARRFPYYGPRGRYLSNAARIADELIATKDLERALEVGPHLRPLIVGADVIDRKANADLALEPSAELLVHDLRRVPWPIADGRYDLFVALQVFEHLGDAQNQAFREVVRVARHAIISLPIDWDMDDPTNSHHMISNERALSWFLPWQPTRVEVGNPGPRTRLIYVFEDLADHPPTASDLA
jgi:Methyltransferase domain